MLLSPNEDDTETISNLSMLEPDLSIQTNRKTGYRCYKGVLLVARLMLWSSQRYAAVGSRMRVGLGWIPVLFCSTI